MRFSGLAAAALVCIFLPELASGLAHADTVTYDLNLQAQSPFNALGAGTGAFTVQLAPDQASNDAIGYATPYFPGSGLSDFSVTIAGEIYTSPGNQDVYLEDGQVNQLIFSSVTVTSSLVDDLVLDNGSYTLLRIANLGQNETIESENGTYTATQVTPEPASWLLLGTGLSLGLAFVLRRFWIGAAVCHCTQGHGHDADAFSSGESLWR